MTTKHIVLDEKQVEHISSLVNIELTTDEKRRYATELTSTLNAIEDLNKVDTTSTNPTYQTSGISNRFLESSNKQTLTQQDALRSAPETKNGYFRINALHYSK